MSFDFLAPDAATAGDRFNPLARSAMEDDARAAGARFEVRDGWNVAVGYSSAEQEREAARRLLLLLWLDLLPLLATKEVVSLVSFWRKPGT